MTESLQKTGYDKQEIPVLKVALLGIATLVFIGVVAVMGRSLFILSKEQTYDRKVLSAPAPYLDDLRAAEAERLTSYGVVDADKGIYHMPIDAAMKKLASKAK